MLRKFFITPSSFSGNKQSDSEKCNSNSETAWDGNPVSLAPGNDLRLNKPVSSMCLTVPSKRRATVELVYVIVSALNGACKLSSHTEN